LLLRMLWLLLALPVALEGGTCTMPCEGPQAQHPLRASLE
jgi:hypothetical protein